MGLPFCVVSVSVPAARHWYGILESTRMSNGETPALYLLECSFFLKLVAFVCRSDEQSYTDWLLAVD